MSGGLLGASPPLILSGDALSGNQKGVQRDPQRRIYSGAA
jgi:hypothetical protein